MRVRIIELPPEPRRASYEVDLRPYAVGRIYDVGPRIAEYLILMGFAQLEMRSRDQAADWQGSRRRHDD